jgi:hypothetical protein
MIGEVHTLSKGVCLVANSRIRKGTTILIENPITSIVTNGGFNDNRDTELHTLANKLLKLSIHDKNAKEFVNMICSEEDKHQYLYGDDIRNISKYVYNSLNREVDINICIKVVQKMTRNVFTITDNELNKVGIGMYQLASRFNHSCSPNAIQTFDGDILTIRSTTDIDKNEEITISYIDTGNKYACIRRIELWKQYAFYCHCNRCCQENSSMNYWKCTNNCTGVYSNNCSISHCNIYQKWLSNPISVLNGNDTFLQPSHSSHLILNNKFKIIYELSLPIEHICINKTYEPFIYNHDYYCNKCNSRLTCVEIAQIIDDITNIYYNKIKSYESKVIIQNNKNLSDSLIRWYLALFDILVKKLGGHQYAVFDIGTKLCLSYIHLKRYSDALRINMRYLPAIKYCYSQNVLLSEMKYHNVAAIQFIQIAKLTNVYDESLFKHDSEFNYYDIAVRIIGITHGENSLFYREVISML